MCGRYPPGSCIVDEVTKDLLNGGSSNSSNATDRDETRLETTEDMQVCADKEYFFKNFYCVKSYKGFVIILKKKP